ncbi:hypothetical protein SDC9_109291 [bioreactor metagenome]|uniref:Uncharacterized protein n=1 Tax=bioreactor metagenome TaxID=1076179 RepID=A0A645BAC2_9ZZZZ
MGDGHVGNLEALPQFGAAGQRRSGRQPGEFRTQNFGDLGAQGRLAVAIEFPVQIHR